MRTLAPAVAAAMLCCSCGLGSTGAWRAAAQPPNLISGFGTAVPLPDGRAGVFGDLTTSTGQPVARTLIYDSRADRWSDGTPIPEARYSESVAVLRDGEVLFAGGFGQTTNATQTQPTILKSAFVYDANADAWRRVGDMTVARAGTSAVVLSDGRVLVAGGGDQSADLFNPAGGDWSRSGQMRESRAGEVLASLPNGGALAAGGCHDTTFGSVPSASASAEIFDPVTATWNQVTPMPHARCGATGIALSDGRVLVIAGWTPTTTGLEFSSEALLFEPRTRSWSSAGGTVATSAFQRTTQTLPVAAIGDHGVFVPIAESGQGNGRVSTVVVGGQLYDSAMGGWSFATSTTASTSAQFGSPQIMGVVPLDRNRALVLLENASLLFDAHASPPQSAVLDSSQLTMYLLAVIGMLLIIMAIAFAAGHRRMTG
jgi:hypothetical protein